MPELTLDHAIHLAALIAAGGILWDAAEIWAARRQTLSFFDWDLIKSRYYIFIGRPRLEQAFDAVCEDRPFLVFVSLHAVAAVAFVIAIPDAKSFAALLAGIVLLGHLLIHFRLLVGLDGADQMQTVVWAGLLVYSCDIGPTANMAAAGFIAVQLILSYLVAGVAKAVSPTWRSGAAVSQILRTSSYSTPWLAQLTQQRVVSWTASWATIIFEVASPFLLLLGQPGALTFLTLGIFFHVSVAVCMGLTTFVWAFIAAHPIVYVLVAG